MTLMFDEIKVTGTDQKPHSNTEVLKEMDHDIFSRALENVCIETWIQIRVENHSVQS